MGVNIETWMQERKKSMKVTLLLAQCTSGLLEQSVQIVTDVLRELEVETLKVELHKLPYFEGSRTRQMDSVIKAIESSKGVIAISNVPLLGMHGGMQSFFDHATMYGVESFNKPMFAITYSEWLGEQAAAQMILKGWNILGGIEGGSIYMNKTLPFKPALERLEKEIENFYRLIKQDRPNIGSSERNLYYHMKQGGQLDSISQDSPKQEIPLKEIKKLADIVKQDSFASHLNFYQNREKQQQSSARAEESPRIDLAAREQSISEITQLLQRGPEEEEFKSIHSGVYTRPPQIITTSSSMKRLQQIPHYFAAQHDRSLNLILKYQVTDIEEQGYVVIKNGDCNFEEWTDETPTVEMTLNEEVLLNLLSKKMTYQKAFMLGKLKVKGNFSVLPKLDLIFKAL